MWVIYRKSDQKVLGMSADCEPDLEKEFALAEVVRGLIDPGPLGEYDAIQITDRSKVEAFLNALPNQRVLRKGSEGKSELSIEEPKLSRLILRSDASNVHPVDNIPGIPADGMSFTTVDIQKVDERGQLQTGRSDNDLLYLRTDHGTIYNADGSAAISSIQLKKGQVYIRLVSEKARRVATVQVFNADPNLLDSSIRIEFI
jgi:hypothetical protein